MVSQNKFIVELSAAIENDDANGSIVAFRNGFAHGNEDFIKEIKKKGIFRASRYQYNINVIKKIIRDFLKNTPADSIPLNVTTYLNNILSLSHITYSIRVVYNKILNELFGDELKAFLVSIEWLFWQNKPNTRQAEIKNNYQDFNKEELAEGFSLLFYILCDRFSPSNLTLGIIDTKLVKKCHYLNILSQFAKITFFNNCELLIDNFGYSATRNKSYVLLEAPDPLFEKSLRLGYIHHHLQSFGDYHQIYSHSEANSLEEFSKEFSSRFKNDLFFIETRPIKRIVLQLPMMEAIKTMVNNPYFFKEEVAELISFKKEYLISEFQINEVPIYKTISLLDLVLFERFFRLLYWTYEEFIRANDLESSELFIQSVLPVSSTEKLINVMEYLWGSEKGLQLFQLLSWTPDSNSFFDLQSSPILILGKWTVYPISLIAKTNLARNVLQKLRFRFDSNSGFDPVGDELANALKFHFHVVHRDISYTWNGINGEIDILCQMDNKVFVFECKNSLHPCNNFELRTTIDYIQKAGDQLTKFNKLFESSEFQDYISNKLKCKNLMGNKLTTCIAMGNRMFSGWEEQGHKVRPVHELCNLLETGIIISRNIRPNNDDSIVGGFRVWKGSRFDTEDLENYINKDSIHKPRFNSMIPINNGIMVRGKKLLISSFITDFRAGFNRHNY
jgi:hypothetical protein